MGPILADAYQAPLTKSNIVDLEAGTDYGSAVAMLYGLPVEGYRQYIAQHFAATRLRYPRNIEDLIKVSVLAAQGHNPISMTMSNTRTGLANHSSLGLKMRDNRDCFLFLPSEDDMATLTAFWNSRWNLRTNSLLLPKDAAMRNLPGALATLAEVMPSLRALFVLSSTSRRQAQSLRRRFENAFVSLGHKVSVIVIHDRLKYLLAVSHASWQVPVSSTRLIAADGTVRFAPAAPPGHVRGPYAFGFDVEIELATGARFSLPRTRTSANLLSNELERLDNAERNVRNLGTIWLRKERIRPTEDGVAGIIEAGKESRFFLHPDEIIISRHIRAMGVEVIPNDHTRYAQGVVRRFGGLDKVRGLIASGGAEILRALAQPRAEQKGLNLDQICAYLTRSDKVDGQKTKRLVEHHLPDLLSAGLVRRGYALKCTACYLTDWYGIETVGEIVECAGCGSPIQLPFRLQFSYEANELARRLIRAGGQAVLETMSTLLGIDSSGAIQFGGDLRRIGQTAAFAEADLLHLTGMGLTIAECKAYHTISDEQVLQITQSLDKSVDTARQLEARLVFLGITTSTTIPSLFSVVTRRAADAKTEGIGVHLVLNGAVYPWGEEPGKPPHEVNTRDLYIPASSVENYPSVGEAPREYQWGWDKQVDESVIIRWHEEMSA